MTDIVEVYIIKRLSELEDMMSVYDEALEDRPIDLIARKHELMRLLGKLREYKDVEEAGQ